MIIPKLNPQEMTEFPGVIAHVSQQLEQLEYMAEHSFSESVREKARKDAEYLRQWHRWMLEVGQQNNLIN